MTRHRHPLAILLLVAALLGLIWQLFRTEATPDTIATPIIHPARSFGYQIGDVLQHQVSVTVPAAFKLAHSALPKPGPLTPWLQLKQLDVDNAVTDRQRHYTLSITYQLFKGVQSSTTLQTPALPLQFLSGSQTINTQIPAWQLNYTPLIPASLADEEVPIRPSAELPPVDVYTAATTILLWTLAGTLMLLYGLWRLGLLPFFNPRNGPFARACRQLKQLQQDPDTTDGKRARQAAHIVHRAFNETAGRTLFCGQLQAFYQSHPAYTHLHQDTEQFFRLSRQLFFQSEEKTPADQLSLTWLTHLCQQCRQIERMRQ